jgi:hypothetical protein
MWIWFIPTSIIISLAIMLSSGSLQIKQAMRTNAPLEEFSAHMDERIPALMGLYGIPGCNIALVRDSEVVWTKAYGYADVASGRAMTTDTPMSVQSITKSVTAWGVIRLAEKGLLDLDAPVSQFLTSWEFPQSGYPTEKITTRQCGLGVRHSCSLLCCCCRWCYPHARERRFNTYDGFSYIGVVPASWLICRCAGRGKDNQYKTN